MIYHVLSLANQLSQKTEVRHLCKLMKLKKARAFGTTIIFQHINDLAVFGVLINMGGGDKTKFEIHSMIFLAKLSKTLTTIKDTFTNFHSFGLKLLS